MADKGTLISTREAARRLGILDNPEFANWNLAVLRLVRRGRLDGRRVGRKTMIVERSLTQFILTGRGA